MPRSWGRGADNLGGDAQSERESAGRLIWGRRAGRLAAYGCATMPAPTVSFVASSMRMNAPVERLVA
jgi:hypothetical protein